MREREPPRISAYIQSALAPSIVLEQRRSERMSPCAAALSLVSSTAVITLMERRLFLLLLAYNAIVVVAV